jgi:hypothetical protein
MGEKPKEIKNYPRKSKKKHTGNCIFPNFSKKSEPLIKKCWLSTLYTAHTNEISYQEKFINMIQKSGKKGKAYSLLTEIALHARRKMKDPKRNSSNTQQVDLSRKCVKRVAKVRKKSEQKKHLQKGSGKGNKRVGHGIEYRNKSLLPNKERKKILSFKQLLRSDRKCVNQVLKLGKV